MATTDFIGPFAAGSRPSLDGTIGLSVSISNGSDSDPAAPGSPLQNRASDRPGKAASRSGPSRSTTVAGISRRLTGSGSPPARRHGPGGHDHQRHLHELPVQAAAVEEQQVVAQVLAVIRGDDHQGVV